MRSRDAAAGRSQRGSFESLKCVQGAECCVPGAGIRVKINTMEEVSNKSCKELDTWKEARKLVKLVYDFSMSFPGEEKFGLTQQLRRAAVSVPSNISEGVGRNYPKDTLLFLFVARGSLYEIETQLYLAHDLKYCSGEEAEPLIEKVILTRKLLNGLIRHYESKLN